MTRLRCILFVIIFIICSSGRSGFCSSPLPDRISITLGASYSLTQLGLSPFSELRRWYDRGIASPFLYIEYAQPIQKNELVFGFQIIQKGFSTWYESPPSTTIYFVEQYQYRLSYLEIPVLYRFNGNRYAMTAGAYIGYLYDDTYRENNTTTIYSNPPKQNSIFIVGQYPHQERFKSWDGGIRLGVSRKLTNSLFIDFSYQKGLVDVDNRRAIDLKYNVSFLLGLRYKFLSSK